jgi:hypothetical protein
MDKRTFEALQKLMGAIGEVQDGEIYLHDPYAKMPKMFIAYGQVYGWMQEIEKEVD